MNSWLPVLVLFAGIGSFVSVAQAKQIQDPFDRYLAESQTGRHEAALVRTAAQCGVKFDTASVRNAVRPEETWKLIRSLARARNEQETDFFGTAQVWQSGDKTLVEVWNMDSEAGDEVRTLYCLHNRQVIYGEQIEWSSADEANSSWAYEVRWNVIQGKFFKTILERFVDDHEKPVLKPKLGPNAPKVFGIVPEMGTWADLRLPNEMLQ